MMIWTIGFLAVAFLAAVLGYPGLASGAAGLAMAVFLLVFAMGSAITLWQLFTTRGTAPPAPPV